MPTHDNAVAVHTWHYRPCYNITEWFCDASWHMQQFPSTHAYCDLGLNAFCGVAGSFYSDLPQVESVGVTLQYDMGAPLHSPIWLDGYQFFQVSFQPTRCWLVVQ
jgi:hypothetical protein